MAIWKSQAQAIQSVCTQSTYKKNKADVKPTTLMSLAAIFLASRCQFRVDGRVAEARNHKIPQWIIHGAGGQIPEMQRC